MKTGKSLTDLATEIERQQNAKHDYIAGSAAITMQDDAKAIVVTGAGKFGITNHARRQLADKLNIPWPYFDRLDKELPHLLAKNVNELAVAQPKNMMVRTLDGNARAFLSDRFRTIDNYDLCDAILPTVYQYQKQGLEIASCEVTDTRLYIKMFMPWLDRELPVPEGLKMGQGHNWFVRKIYGAVTISNSETGAGRLSINPGVFERQCTNLASFEDEGFGRMHIGKKQEADENVARYLTQETQRLEDAAIWAKARDVMNAILDGRVMEAIVDKLNASRGDVIQNDPAKVIEVFAKKNGLNDTEQGGLLRHLVDSGEMSRYGLQWAVTRLSQDVESYDRASELERLGGRVIELPSNDWKELLAA